MKNIKVNEEQNSSNVAGKVVPPEAGELESGLPPLPGFALADLDLWFRRVLNERLRGHVVREHGDYGAVVNSYAAAEIPDWELRQKQDLVRDAINGVNALLASKPVTCDQGITTTPENCPASQPESESLSQSADTGEVEDGDLKTVIGEAMFATLHMPERPTPTSGAEWTTADIMPLLEHALQLATLTQCDCDGETCSHECLGGRIWTAVYRARKLYRSSTTRQQATAEIEAAGDRSAEWRQWLQNEFDIDLTLSDEKARAELLERDEMMRADYGYLRHTAMPEAVAKVWDEAIQMLQQKVDYYKARERNAERDVAPTSVEQEKKLAFILSNFTAELIVDLEAAKASALKGGK